MVISDLSVALLLMKDESRSVITVSGALSVMTHGMYLMLMLFVANWAFQIKVTNKVIF